METDLKDIAMKKAMLLASGPVMVREGLRLPVLPSRSTAGPGAGSVGIVIEFEGHRAKKAITSNEGPDLELVKEGERYHLLLKGKVFLEDVKIRPTIFHSPEQAFFNLETECIFDCKFCTSRRLEKGITKNLTPEKVVRMILEVSKRPDFKAVALTSAVAKNPRATVDKMIYVVSEVRQALGPGVPIGVEPYIDDLKELDELKQAGATEFKLNLESYDPVIFQKVCGELDLEWIMHVLEQAVKVFGRGKVSSNIIVGMGETDENVLQGAKALAEIGVVATFRPLRINDLNRQELEEALGRLEPVSPERLVSLAEREKVILEEHGLTTLTFETMCNLCTCCDIVPFRDI